MCCSKEYCDARAGRLTSASVGPARRLSGRRGHHAKTSYANDRLRRNRMEGRRIPGRLQAPDRPWHQSAPMMADIAEASSPRPWECFRAAHPRATGELYCAGGRLRMMALGGLRSRMHSRHREPSLPQMSPSGPQRSWHGRQACHHLFSPRPWGVSRSKVTSHGGHDRDRMAG